MTAEQKAAYIYAQATSALVEALGMLSTNLHSERKGWPLKYDERAFSALINQYGIHHNNMIELFRD